MKIIEAKGLEQFDQFPDSSRVWIYQIQEKLDFEQIENLNREGEVFAKEWNSHGATMSASMKVCDLNSFVLVVNESITSASGCSIDSSVRFVQQLENKFGLTLLNRMLVCSIENEIQCVNTIQEFEEKINSKQIDSSVLIKDNLKTTLGELRTKWFVSAKETWLSRYF